jgi:hypothetical protein
MSTSASEVLAKEHSRAHGRCEKCLSPDGLIVTWVVGEHEGGLRRYWRLNLSGRPNGPWIDGDTGAELKGSPVIVLRDEFRVAVRLRWRKVGGQMLKICQLCEIRSLSRLQEVLS